MPRPVVAVVLPALNEARNLAELVPRIVERLLLLAVRYEILVIDDGSTDDTAGLLPEMARLHRHVRYIRLSRNFGKEAAISAGLARSRAEAVIIMDADGQHPVELLDQFIMHWRAGRQVVYAIQRARTDGWLRARLKRAYYALLDKGVALHIPPHAGDFRLLDRKVVDALNSLPERNRYMKGLYAWVGFDTLGIEFDPLPRARGTTRFNWRRLARLGLTGYTAFSVLPLRLISLAGLLVSTAAFAYAACIVVAHFLHGTDVPGWPTVVAGMMLLSGVQLLSLGIIGEYVGRVFDEVKQRPLYVVAEERDGEMDAAHALMKAAISDAEASGRAA